MATPTRSLLPVDRVREDGVPMPTPRVLSASCPDCRAPVRITRDREIVTCRYCGHHAFVHFPGRPDPKPPPPPPPPPHVPVQHYYQSYYRPYAQYGHIHVDVQQRIYDRQVIVAVFTILGIFVFAVVMVSILAAAVSGRRPTSTRTASRPGPDPPRVAPDVSAKPKVLPGQPLPEGRIHVDEAIGIAFREVAKLGAAYQVSSVEVWELEPINGTVWLHGSHGRVVVVARSPVPQGGFDWKEVRLSEGRLVTTPTAAGSASGAPITASTWCPFRGALQQKVLAKTSLAISLDLHSDSKPRAWGVYQGSDGNARLRIHVPGCRVTPP